MQKYFEEQPTTRPEQVAVLKEKLKAQFKKRFPTLDDIAPGWKNVKAPDPYAYAMMNYVLVVRQTSTSVVLRITLRQMYSFMIDSWH